MQSTLPCGNHTDHIHAERPRRLNPLLGVLGGVLYVVAALVLMQVLFRFWMGMW
jgi:hypothetical protein